MLRNVNSTVGATAPPEGENSDLITISRTEYNKLVSEREEYRNISLELASRLPNLRKVQTNIEAILAKGSGDH